MKKPVMLFSLVVWLIFANTAIAIQWINSRGVWTWAVNNRYYQYTDQYGWKRFSGDAQVRIYQSEAENFEPFELDWQWGVVFEEIGFAWGENDRTIYIQQSWHRRTSIPNQPRDVWLPAHYCYYGEPTVWGADCDRLFGLNYISSNYPYGLLDPVREEESTHFHGWYYFGF